MICVALDDQLYLAPLASPKYVLDVATGTGIWAIEIALRHPQARVIGTDLSAIQPSNHPANCDFIKDDAEEEWVFPQVPAFDLVHLRMVCMSFDDPMKVMKSAVGSLKEGTGWVEYHDIIPAPEWMDEGEGGEFPLVDL
jgi:ubiquinone/menaquinone biosynthesis C-methylase UbiE